MNTNIEKNTSHPAYMQLYENLKKEITDGVYHYGEKLPSKRTIREDYNISVITVQHAYEMLCDEGYVRAKQRSGYFVSFKRENWFASTESAVLNIHHPQNHTDTGEFPFSILAKTMRKVITLYGESLLDKSPNTGIDEVKEAISAYLARSRGIHVDTHQIIIGSGSEYLYGLIIQLLGRNRLYAIENPSYDKIRDIYYSHGVRYDMLRMANDGISTSELARTRSTVLHITPFNSYPSGITATASKRKEYIVWAKERNGYIIEDDFDSEFTLSSKSEDTVFSLDPDRVFYLNTFTKTISPSMRLGYMIVPEPMVKAFYKKLGFYSCTVPVFEQYMLTELINSGDFERHINRTRRQRRQQKSKKQN